MSVPSRDVSSMRVHQTNEDATLSKRSASKIGYFADPILKYFCKKLVRRTTLINRIYYYRVKAIRTLLRAFMDSFDGGIQVINLGCGYDTGVYVCNHPKKANLKYFELDLPEVIDNKRELLQKIAACGDADVVNLGLDATMQRTSFISCDLAGPDVIIRNLLSHGLSTKLPTLILAECVLQYVQPENSTRLLAEINQLFRNESSTAYIALFDQIEPHDAFGQVMRRNLKKRSSELHGIRDYDSTDAHTVRLQVSGWSGCCAPFLDVIHYLRKSDQTEALRTDQLEPFDEHEHYFETCRHYCLSLGHINTSREDSEMQKVIRGMTQHVRAEPVGIEISSFIHGAVIDAKTVLSMSFSGYGHASVGYYSAQTGHRILTFGGFSKQGSRSKHSLIWDVSKKYEKMLWFDSVSPSARMHHAMSLFFSVQTFDDNESNFTASAQVKPLCVPYDSFRGNQFIQRSILLFGGRSAPTTVFGDAYLFDCDNEAWEQIQLGEEVAPSERFRHGMTTIDIQEGGDMFIETFQGKKYLAPIESIFAGSVLLFGGLAEESTCLNDVWLFCSVKRLWTLLETKGAIPQPRHSHAMCYDPLSKQVFVSGGISQEGYVLNDFYALDMATKCWKRKDCPSNTLQLFSHTMTFIPASHSIIFVGGVSPSCSHWRENGTFTVYDVERSTFSSCKAVPQVCGHQTAYFPSLGLMYIIGGGLQCFSFGSAYNDSFVVDVPKSNDRPFQPVITTIDLRSASLTMDDWSSTLYPHRLPVHFKAMALGECIEKWSNIDYLLSCEKSTQVIVHKMTNPQCRLASNHVYRMDFIEKNFIYTQQPFAELVANCFRDEAPTYFRSIARQDASCDFWDSFPSLAKDFEVPEVFANTVMSGKRYWQSCLRVSSANMQLWTHYDIMDNILCQITGSKRVVLYPPAAYPHLQMSGSVSRVIDMDDPSNPELQESAIEVILNPGDVLFIPALWFHSVTTLSPSIGINIFWRHLDSDSYTNKDNYGNHDLPTMTEARGKVMAHVKEALQNVPREYQLFTLLQLADEIKKC